MQEGTGNNPVRLVKTALKTLQRQKRKGVDFDYVWIVCDGEEHPEFPDIVRHPPDKKVKIAYTNPCIEFWLYLHFHYSDNGTDAAGARSLLERCEGMESYTKAQPDIYARCRDRTEAAIENAEKLREYHRIQEEEAWENPSTTMDLLIKQLEKLPNKRS